MDDLTLDLHEKYQALVACISMGAEMMRPGIKSSQIQAVMQNHLKEHGITASFPHGHGLGLEIRDYPIIVPENGLRIREGMVNNL
jgi:Xaa-Pro aminopeptidase